MNVEMLLRLTGAHPVLTLWSRMYNEPAGCLDVTWEASTKRGYLRGMFVGLGFRRCGVGRGLVRRALAYLREQGCREVWLGVDPGEAQAGAVEFWRAMGFEERAGDGWDVLVGSVVMARDLEKGGQL